MRALPVIHPSPKLPPATVTLPDPVEAPFMRISTLPAPDANETAELTLPPLSPTVINARRLPAPPLSTLHCMLVSEDQLEPSHPVTPTAADPVCIVRPILLPCTETVTDPVDPTFLPCNTLPMLASTVSPAVMLPTRAPTLIAAARLPTAPTLPWHSTDVSAAHDDRSQPVPPDLPPAV